MKRWPFSIINGFKNALELLKLLYPTSFSRNEIPRIGNIPISPMLSVDMLLEYIRSGQHFVADSLLSNFTTSILL